MIWFGHFSAPYSTPISYETDPDTFFLIEWFITLYVCVYPSGPLTESRNLSEYAITAGTTAVNAQRLLRALKLQRPVLLEGSPGVGKTSLVAALAKASGNHLVRINLSEQTVTIYMNVHKLTAVLQNEFKILKGSDADDV